MCRQCNEASSINLAAQGLLPALAPIVPHLAEDAWQALPWAAPRASVFQAGWCAPPPEWGSLPEAQAAAFRVLLLIRWDTPATYENGMHGSVQPCSDKSQPVTGLSDMHAVHTHTL